MAAAPSRRSAHHQCARLRPACQVPPWDGEAMRPARRASQAPGGREPLHSGPPGTYTSRSAGRVRGSWPGKLRALVRLAVTAEGDLNDPFVGAADDGQLDGAATRGLERIEQVVVRAYRLARGRHDQVALGEPGA